jgi:hypothetical protein
VEIDQGVWLKGHHKDRRTMHWVFRKTIRKDAECYVNNADANARCRRHPIRDITELVCEWMYRLHLSRRRLRREPASTEPRPLLTITPPETYAAGEMQQSFPANASNAAKNSKTRHVAG